MDGTGPKNNGNSGRNGDGDRRVRRGVARWNALKHGVLSQPAVLPTEDPSQFQELLKNLREDRKPKGALEELLVEKVAVCFWRLRRILVHDFGNNLCESNSGVLAATQTYTDLDTHIKQVADIRQEMTEGGSIADLKERLRGLVERRVVELKRDLSSLTDEEARQLPDPIIALLERSAEKSKREAQARRLALAIVNKSMDTLLRYETANERQLNRAIDQLERLQRQRAGDYVPPPVKVGVSTDV